MARTLNIKCSNLKNLNKFMTKLEKALPEVSKETVQTATMAMEATAKEKCPVRTGRLRDSINSRIEEKGNDEITGIVSTDVEYASYVEYGTSKMSAKPYMTPAFNEHKDDIDDFFMEKLKQKLR